MAAIGTISTDFIAPGVSRNKRWYRPEVIEKALARLQARLADETALPVQMLSHHGADDDSKEIAARVLTATLDPTTHVGTLNGYLIDTRAGRDIAAATEVGPDGRRTLDSVSLRGWWIGPVRRVEHNGEMVETGDDLEIDGVDFTRQPGIVASRIRSTSRITTEADARTPITESVEARVEVITETVAAEGLDETLVVELREAGADGYVDEHGDLWLWSVEEARYVRTAAGSRRYGLPVGALIVSKREKRDAKMAPIVKAHKAALDRAQRKHKTGPYADAPDTRAEFDGRSNSEILRRNAAAVKAYIAGASAGKPDTDPDQARHRGEAERTGAEIQRRAESAKSNPDLAQRTLDYAHTKHPDFRGVADPETGAVDDLSVTAALRHMRDMAAADKDDRLRNAADRALDDHSKWTAKKADRYDTDSAATVDRGGPEIAQDIAATYDRIAGALDKLGVGRVAARKGYARGKDNGVRHGNPVADNLRAHAAALRAAADQAQRKPRTGPDGGQAPKDSPATVANRLVLSRDLQGDAKGLSDDDLQAADAEFKRRATALGHPGKVSKAHRAVKTELKDRPVSTAPVRGGDAKSTTAPTATTTSRPPGALANYLLLLGDTKTVAKDMSIADLKAVDAEFERRAALLGKAGKVIKAHRAVKAELARRSAEHAQPAPTLEAGDAPVSPAETEEQHVPDDVVYADNGYLPDGEPRYPLDTRTGAVEAWRAIHTDAVADSYGGGQLRKMRSKTRRALERHGVEFTADGLLITGVAEHAPALAGAEAPDKVEGNLDVRLGLGPLSVSVSSHCVDPDDLDRLARLAAAAVSDALSVMTGDVIDVDDDLDDEPVHEWPMEALDDDEDDDGDEPLESAPTAAPAATTTHQEDAAVAETTTETDEIETEGVEEGKLPPAFLKNIKKKKDAAKDADTSDTDSDDEDDTEDDEDEDGDDRPAFLKKKKSKKTKESDVTDTVTETAQERVARLVEEKVASVLAEREAERKAAEEAALVEKLVAERLAAADKPAEVAETDEQRIERLVAEKLAAQQVQETEEARIARLVDAGVKAALQDHAMQNGVTRTGLTATSGTAATESADPGLAAAGLPVGKPIHQYGYEEQRALTAAVGQEFLAGFLPAGS